MLLMNILRSITFRKEHVILVDTIPALKHELNSLNYFLNPAIDELSALWKGIKVNTHNSPSSPVKIQAAVLCFASDIPGARELCVFLGHSARQGCSQNFQVVLETEKLWWFHGPGPVAREILTASPAKCQETFCFIDKQINLTYISPSINPLQSPALLCIYNPGQKSWDTKQVLPSPHLQC